MRLLKTIRVAGWKSIKDQTIDLTPCTVIIGANGAGKTNLLSLFKMLNTGFASATGFRSHVALNGYADSLLHYGAKQTPEAEIELIFLTEDGEIRYFARWAAGANGSLIFVEERVSFFNDGTVEPSVLDLGAGHSESSLYATALFDDQKAEIALNLLRSCRLFHFSDTSNQSAARQPSMIELNRSLRSDAGNLAAMLYLFRQRYPAAYRRITATVRQMVPDFDGFSLEPSRLNDEQIFLNWTQKGRDYEFGPHQLSDGSLRLIALATLLLQPEENLPLLIALDEPELGLHPAALEVLAEIARTTSQSAQLLLATQSSVFLDYFSPEDVIVVNSVAGVSEFRRLDSEELAAWLEEYTLGEVWEKNVFGGGPYG